MKSIKHIPGKERLGKMGFDNYYFIVSRCTCCGVTMELRNDELWKTRCADCAPELYQDQGVTTLEP